MAKTTGAASAITDLPLVGTVSFAAQTLAAGAGVIVAKTFPTAFPTSPLAFCNVSTGAGGTAGLVARAVNVTTTGFDCILYNVSASSITWASAITVSYIASI